MTNRISSFPESQGRTGQKERGAGRKRKRNWKFPRGKQYNSGNGNCAQLQNDPKTDAGRISLSLSISLALFSFFRSLLAPDDEKAPSFSYSSSRSLSFICPISHSLVFLFFIRLYILSRYLSRPFSAISPLFWARPYLALIQSLFTYFSSRSLALSPCPALSFFPFSNSVPFLPLAEYLFSLSLKTLTRWSSFLAVFHFYLHRQALYSS